ncbi:MAG: DUF308 domain-containing protein [Clostridiales bacterium]|nr:DUF308 domain-containing protein [Clostridiales bacterium]
MNIFKKVLSGMLLAALEALAGILLLINPEAFTSAIIIALGAGLLIFGLVSAVKYFRADAAAAAEGQLFFKGLVLMLAGAFCIFRTGWFVTVFPLLTDVYGAVIILVGLGKVQTTADAIRFGNRRWYVAAASAALSVACGAVIVLDPFAAESVLWIFTGVSLVAAAAVDFVSIFCDNGKSGEGK